MCGYERVCVYVTSWVTDYCFVAYATCFCCYCECSGFFFEWGEGGSGTRV